MRSIGLIGSFAALAISAPLAAQSNKFRTDDRLPSTSTIQNEQGRAADRVPPGQLPPAGMCRIWIAGVPPGRQPAPTDCQTAVANKPANARVLWGDQTAFPGKGKSEKVRGLRTGRDSTLRAHGKGHGDNDDADDENDDDDQGENKNTAQSRQSSAVNRGINAPRGKSLKSKKGKGHGDD